MKDRLEMPYTEAVLHEAQRFLSLIPLGFTRVVKKDFELEGFKIPKVSRRNRAPCFIKPCSLFYPKAVRNPGRSTDGQSP